MAVLKQGCKLSVDGGVPGGTTWLPSNGGGVWQDVPNVL
jgi:hypothetical protein